MSNSDRIRRQTTENINTVMRSKLSHQEKALAIENLNNMYKKLLFLVCGIFVISVAIIFAVHNLIEDELIFLAFCGGIIFLDFIIMVIYVMIIRRKSLWKIAYDKVALGFDGLSEEEINYLKPTSAGEKRYLIKLKIKRVVLYIGLIIVLIIISVAFGIICDVIEIADEYDTVTAILLLITYFAPVIFFGICISDNNVEIQRVKSGYYKLAQEYRCLNCGTRISFTWEEIMQSEYTNKEPEKQCEYCGKFVQCSGALGNMKSFKKFQKEIR